MHLISFSPPASPASSASPAYPPHKIALLPNVTISCFAWDKRPPTQRIIVRPKSEIIGFYKNPEQAISQERAEEILRAMPTAASYADTEYV